MLRKFGIVDQKELVGRALLTFLCAYGLLIGGTVEGLITARTRMNSMLLLTLVSLLIGGWWLRAGLRRLTWQPTPADLIAALWGMAILLSWAVNGLSSRRSSIGGWYDGLVLIVLLVVANGIARGLPRRWFLDAVLLAGLPLLFFGYQQLFGWLSGWSIYASVGVPFSPVRPPSLLGNPNTLATVLIVLILLAVMRISSATSAVWRLLWIAYTALTGVLLLFTQSRGAWFGLAIGLGVALLIWLPGSGLLARAAHLSKRYLPLLVGGALIGLIAFLAIGVLLVRSSGRVDARGGIYQVALQSFLQSPLLGHGPDSFSRQLLEAQSIPPETPHSHAHDIPLHIAAELGLIGLLAAGATLYLSVRAFRQQLGQAAAPAERLLLISVGGALAAYTAHGLLDIPASQPASFMLGAWLLAAALSGQQMINQSGDPATPKTAAWRFVPMGALCLVLLISGWWSTLNYSVYTDGLAHAAPGHYRASALLLERAAQADPNLPVVWSSAGYVNGLAALVDADSSALTAAISDYERALELEPPNAIDWQNLAVLYAQAGRADDAIRASAQAVRHAAAEPIFAINQGLILEQFGKPEEARQVYRAALILNPALRNDPLWQSSALHKEVAALTPPAPDSYDQLMSALGSGQVAQARAAIAEQKALNGLRSMPYINAALFEIATHGDLALAEQNIHAAQFLYAPYVDDGAWIHYALSELANARGDTAARDYERERAQRDITSDIDGTSIAYGINLPIATYFHITFSRTLLPKVWYPTTTPKPLWKVQLPESLP